jgi:hypothetical protein
VLADERAFALALREAARVAECEPQRSDVHSDRKFREDRLDHQVERLTLLARIVILLRDADGARRSRSIATFRGAQGMLCTAYHGSRMPMKA